MLRREAEGLILPKLPAFRRGEYRPQDKDERLALLAGELASCEFEGLHGAAARLYSDAFAAEPKLAEDVLAATRYHAARAAALAGCGQGKDADQLPDQERALRRGKPSTGSARTLPGVASGSTTAMRRLTPGSGRGCNSGGGILTWPASARKDALARLPDEERERWERLWSDVDALLRV